MRMPQDNIDTVLQEISKGNYGPAQQTIRDLLDEAEQIVPPSSIAI